MVLKELEAALLEGAARNQQADATHSEASASLDELAALRSEVILDGLHLQSHARVPGCSTETAREAKSVDVKGPTCCSYM